MREEGHSAVVIVIDRVETSLEGVANEEGFISVIRNGYEAHARICIVWNEIS